MMLVDKSRARGFEQPGQLVSDLSFSAEEIDGETGIEAGALS